jgi:hypothetical protein
MIELFDAESGMLFANVEADDEGDWRYKKDIFLLFPAGFVPYP